MTNQRRIISFCSIYRNITRNSVEKRREKKTFSIDKERRNKRIVNIFPSALRPEAYKIQSSYGEDLILLTASYCTDNTGTSPPLPASIASSTNVSTENRTWVFHLIHSTHQKLDFP